MPVPDLTDRSLAQLTSLEGRAAVVTGAARGLGRAIAGRLAEAGACVLLSDVDAAGAQAASEEITRRSGGAHSAIRLDVADTGSIVAAAESSSTWPPSQGSGGADRPSLTTWRPNTG